MTALLTHAQNENICKTVLHKPLITGASLSADFGSMSPGKRLAARFTSPNLIHTLAQPGKPAREIIKSLGPDTFHDRTIVIAMDLFFWDSTLPDIGASLKALQNVMTWVQHANIPIVLGNIPELLPGHQPQRARLNAAIGQACRAYSACYVMPFVAMHKRLVREGALTINGRRYNLRQLVPDGLHLSEVASNYLADVLGHLLSGRIPRAD